MSKIISLAVAGTVLAISAGTMGASHALAKNITLIVDGVPRQVRAVDDTVAQLLVSQNISLGSHDLVSPSVSNVITDGTQIAVNYGRPVQIAVDGKPSDAWTTATTVQDLLSQLHLHGVASSVAPSTPIGRDGIALAVETPKTVTVVTKDGTKTVRTTGRVGDALKAAGITLGKEDAVKPGRGELLTEGMAIKVVTVETKRYEKLVVLPFASTTKDDESLPQGTTKVATEGKDGVQHEWWQQRLEDGVVVSDTKVSDGERQAPVDQVTLVGTKAPVADSTAVASTAAAPAAAAPAAVAPAATQAPARTQTTQTQPQTQAPAPAAPVSYGGTHADWMAAAGISPADYGIVEILIARESGWNPNAVNASSGACGLPQALPCSKLGPNWNNPVVGLAWANSYVISRYGGWGGAWAHSQAYGWY